MKKVEGLRKSFWKGNQRVFLIAFISSLLMNSVNLYLSYVLQVVTDIAAGRDRVRTRIFRYDIGFLCICGDEKCV